MGWRFRRRIKILPGVRLNVTQKGLSSVSVGGRGFTTTVRKRGVTRTISIPGTGLSHTERVPLPWPPPQPPTDRPKPRAMPLLLVVGGVALLAVIAAVGGDERSARVTDVPPAAPPASGCREHVELLGAESWAKELGRSQSWVLANHRINLWENYTEARGRKLGEMLVGSRAVILEVAPNAYRVRSPLDQSEGWVSNTQVARTLRQNVDTAEAC